MIEHCVAAFSKELEERSYRAYVTNALQLIAKNTAALSHGEYITKKWIDLVDKKRSEKEETRTAEQIISDIKGGLRRLSGGENT